MTSLAIANATFGLSKYFNANISLRLMLQVINVSGARPQDVTYDAIGLPCGLVVDSRTGSIRGSARDPVRLANVTVIASVAGRTAPVNGASFPLTVVDCDNATSCNGGICVDDVAFDAIFQCDCNATGKIGERCTIDVPFNQASNGAGIKEDFVIGISIGSAFLILVIVLIVSVRRYRAWQVLNKPLNFDEALEEMKRKGIISRNSVSEKVAGPREIRRGCVVVMEKIGAGAFGEVWNHLLSKHLSPNKQELRNC